MPAAFLGAAFLAAGLAAADIVVIGGDDGVEVVLVESAERELTRTRVLKMLVDEYDGDGSEERGKREGGNGMKGMGAFGGGGTKLSASYPRSVALSLARVGNADSG